MKLYVDAKGDRHYLVTDDGEAVYVEDLEEDGRDTELLEQTVEVAKRRRAAEAPVSMKSLEEENLDPE